MCYVRVMGGGRGEACFLILPPIYKHSLISFLYTLFFAFYPSLFFPFLLPSILFFYFYISLRILFSPLFPFLLLSFHFSFSIPLHFLLFSPSFFPFLLPSPIFKHSLFFHSIPLPIFFSISPIISPRTHLHALSSFLFPSSFNFFLHLFFPFYLTQLQAFSCFLPHFPSLLYFSISFFPVLPSPIFRHSLLFFLPSPFTFLRLHISLSHSFHPHH